MRLLGWQGRGCRSLLLLPVVICGVTQGLGAQDLVRRIAETRNGTVRFAYPAMEGVCGNSRNGISVRRGTGTNRVVTNMSIRDNEWENDCEPGPVRIVLDRRNGRVVDVRSYVGGRWRGTADVDLGTVSPVEASDYLLGLVESADEHVAKDALFPATIAEGVTVWPRLLRIAKDAQRPREVRSSAVFWVSQAAGEEATKGLREIVDEPAGDREVRKSAVFALSQRPKDESVPALIRIAKSHRDAEMRKTAIFWLGQSGDARAIAYFEEVLLRP
ncbi:MAG: HEAT repeat domain-containing protein [Gemmatimonadaceae bacterium]